MEAYRPWRHGVNLHRAVDPEFADDVAKTAAVGEDGVGGAAQQSALYDQGMKSPWAFAAGVAVSALAIVGTNKIQNHRHAAAAMTPVDPTMPVPPIYPGIHQAIIEQEKRDPQGVLFIGDSITDLWRTVPWIWEEAFGKFHPCNAGISFDQIQHAPWRVQNGELDGIHPRVVVLMIGTNNIALGHDDASFTELGIMMLAGEIGKRLPDSKLLLLGLFPRKDQFSAEVLKCNAMLAKVQIHDDSMVYLDVGAQIPPEDFPDGIHPNPDGYRIWAKAMLPTLEKMYGKGPTTRP